MTTLSADAAAAATFKPWRTNYGAWASSSASLQLSGSPPGAVADHRRFTPGPLRDLAAGWEAGTAVPGQSRPVKGRHQGLAVPVKILGRRVTVLAAADLQGDSQRSSSTGGDQHSS
jgi:hypothetical protein